MGVNQKSIFEVIKFDLNNISLMTEFLEACEWDDDMMTVQLEIAKDCLECHHITPSILEYMNFDDWLNKRLVHQMVEAGLTKDQSEIIKRSIINNMDEMLLLMKLEEN